MIGIYCWKNKINNKYYIGQSIDIEKRKKQHIASAGKYSTKISRALVKYGIENFDFQILEETTIEELNKKEAYWIKYYDSIKNGYNITFVDENGDRIEGEFNPNAKMTNEMVLEIRNRIFINNEYPPEVYEDYCDFISYDAFWQAFHGVTWKNVDTSMIKSLIPNNIGSYNPKAKLNEEEVLIIRKRIHINNEEQLVVFQDYKDIVSFAAFKKVVNGETWQNVDTSMIKPLKVERKGKPKAKLNEKIVAQIRYDYENKIKTLQELYQEYSFVTPRTIQRVINYETWQTVKPVSTIPEA